jgi:tetratricopeptide (TPR) repeat protein
LGVPLWAQAKPSPKAVLSPAEQWERLIDRHEIGRAKSLCDGWVRSQELQRQIEAQKCLANVALAQGSQLNLSGNEVGGGTLGEGYTRHAVDEALRHLNEGIRLAPQDRSLHQGRLHVLEVSGRFDDMVKALDESATIYTGSDAPQIWLAYAGELSENGEPTAGLRFCEMLDKHYPNNSDIIGNIGAFNNELGNWDKGLPYVRRAVELNPTDPIDTWNLGWSLDHLGQDEEANKWMSKSIELGGQSDASQRKCLYGQFLVTKLKKEQDGCALVQANCDEGDRSVCKKAGGTAPAN